MIHMSKKAVLTFALALAMVLPASAALAAEGKVTASSLLMREEPNTACDAVYTLRNNAKVQIKYKTSNWYLVKYGNEEGYVYADYIDVTGDVLTKYQYESNSYRLEKDDEGVLVEELQDRLKELGYYSNSCDGKFGDRTVDAVKAFQKNNGLSQDGIAGSATLKKLYSEEAVDAKGKTAGEEEQTASANGTLQKGDKGDAVKELQQRLKELGYYKTTIDGEYGSKTVSAVKAFQKNNDLSETGVADAATQKKLNSSSALDASSEVDTLKTSQTLELGDNNNQVKLMQKRLKELGYYSASPDGNYGYQTLKAVAAFQKNNGLTEDGVAGPSTLTKMVSSSAKKADEKDDASSEKEDVSTNNESLQKGDKGDAVKKLQQRLKDLGYYNTVLDGEYGSKTVSAVKAFQKKNGLTDDGVAGITTLNKLYSDAAVGANDKTESDKDDEEVADDGTLKKGSTGEKVKELQRRLKELGYYSNSIDGDYGSKTVEAVKAFQKKNGLTDDGVAGEATLKKLNSDDAVPASGKTEADKEEEKVDGPLQKGDKGDAVKKLQQRLKDLGYYNTVLDGEYGSKTVSAVKAFQKKNGLTEDGVAGETTLDKLYSDSALSANDKTESDKKEEEDKDDGTLKKGSSGEKVKELQRRLKELGYYSNGIDGNYGDRTVEAVKAFQKKNGLTEDGVAGEATLKKLNSDSAVGAKDKTESDKNEDEDKDDGSLKKGSSGEKVKELQRRLKELGYYNYGIDGNYGDRTVESVKAFQKKNGLTADGVAGEATLKKLNSDSAVNANGGSGESLNTNQTLEKGDNGAQVKALQLRLKELGYYTTTIDSDYGYRTAEAVSDFQRANGLTVDGVAGPATLRKIASSSAITKDEADKKQDDNKQDDEDETTYVTESLDWYEDGQDLFRRKTTVEVKDCRTGLVFKAQVLYGTNHLDVEPLTAADTEILLQINGGVEFKYYRRPVLVKYNGHVYAASIYSEPHGDQTITNNNFEGQFCLHFTGSKLHKKDENGNYKDDADHQKCVQEALKYTW